MGYTNIIIDKIVLRDIDTAKEQAGLLRYELEVQLKQKISQNHKIVRINRDVDHLIAPNININNEGQITGLAESIGQSIIKIDGYSDNAEK